MNSSITWDGTVYPYAPPASDQLSIDESLPLHSATQDVDPITYEVIRFKLWNINVDHGNTIMKISGSPIAAYGHDFNPVILDERGDAVLFGPFLQYLSSATSSAVKWTLENRSSDPGISPGDIFLTNDPWIGATHQPDVCLIAPVFVDGELFCWIGNTLQQWDLGGTAPGGFNPMAPDAFWEPPCIPPIKIVEAGRLRRDVEEMYVRQSRTPKLVALDLRAQTVPLRTAISEIERLCERYGAETVKGTMRKLQDDSEAAFVKRLETIPDGTWTAETSMECAEPGDRNVYTNRVTLTKSGDKLTFTNYGSAEQMAAINATMVGWRGSVMSMVNSQMLFDQMFVLEGALRHCEFRAEPGTISCATHPASVSGGTAGTLVAAIALGGLVLSKALSASTDEALRTEVQSCMGAVSFPVNAVSGVDQRGEVYSSFLLDPLAAALPASPFWDGQDTGGYPWDLQSTAPNVENQELFYPVLCLWRKEQPDSGGAGKYRGGNGMEMAFIPHKTDEILVSTVSSTIAVPAPGLAGGLPSSTNYFEHIAGSGIKEHLSSGGRMPNSITELVEHGGTSRRVGAKTFNNRLDAGDAWYFCSSAASGYGDPLLRDPALVERDVENGSVSVEWAEQVYGVRPGDPEATALLRRTKLADRVDERVAVDPPTPTPSGHGGRQVAESVELKDDQLVCRQCARVLAPGAGNFKEGAIVQDVPLSDVNPYVRPAAEYVDTDVTARHFFCPGCAVQLDSEVVVGGVPVRWDVRLGATDPDEARAF